MNIKRNLAVSYAWEIYRLGLPYIWGGQSILTGFDCSGYLVEILRAVGVLPNRGDKSTAGLFRMFKSQQVSGPGPGVLVFYFPKGPDHEPTHAGICIDGEHSLAFSGGNHHTTTREIAAAIDARCKLRPVDYWDTPKVYLDPFNRIG